MTEDQLTEFFELLGKGVDRQAAVEVLGVLFEPVSERLNMGRAKALEGDLEDEDAVFYLAVKKAEARWEVDWFLNNVLPNAGAAKDVVKAYEPLARKSPTRYGSPGSVKVIDSDSGGKGPVPLMIKQGQALEEGNDVEEN